MTEHTKGPWHYHETYHPRFDGCVIHCDLEGAGHHSHIGRSESSVLSEKEVIANARLMAASPKMLDALLSARKLIDDLGGDFPDHDNKFNGMWASYRDEFEDAIEAATGSLDLIYPEKQTALGHAEGPNE